MPMGITGENISAVKAVSWYFSSNGKLILYINSYLEISEHRSYKFGHLYVQNDIKSWNK